LHAIETMLRRLLAEDETVAVLSPTYFGFLQAIRNVGARIRTIAVDMDDGLDWTAVRTALGAADCRALICTPFAQNPTGYPLEDAAKQELIEICSDNHVAIIEDGIYDDLYFSGERRTSIAQSANGQAYYCSSFSKTLSPALRVGFIVHPSEDSNQIARGYRNIGLPGGADQFALARFISSGRYRRQLERIRPLLAAQLRETIELLRKELPPFSRVSNPPGGRVLWVDLGPDQDSHAIARTARNDGIGVLTGPVCSPKQAHQHFLRIDTGTPLNDARRAALRRLCAIIREKAPGID
jgi:DNA-binding transcriptional MocR family regulator